MILEMRVLPVAILEEPRPRSARRRDLQVPYLFRLGVTFLYLPEDSLGVGRLSHLLGFLVDPVPNERIIATGLLKQLDDFRRFLLAQNGDL